MDVRRLDEMQAQGRSIFDTELAVAYYARVSTDKDEQINSLGNQKRYFEDYIAANPHWTFAGGYVDEGISGTSVEGREQFLRMIEDAKRGRFDLIITKEISRFARNTLDSLSYTRELLCEAIHTAQNSDFIAKYLPEKMRTAFFAAKQAEHDRIALADDRTAAERQLYFERY